MKRLMVFIIMSAFVAGAAMAGVGHKDDPIETRVRAQSPEVQQMIMDLRVFLNKQQGKARFKRAQDNAYVGSEYCMACHTWSKRRLPDTKHFQFLRRPLVEWTTVSGKGMMGDMDGNGQDDFLDGLDFNTIESAFDAYKPNAPILSVEDGQYYITIGDLKMPVVFTQAGFEGGGQRMTVRIPVTDTESGYSRSPYWAPVNWSGTAWTVYGGTRWWNGNTPIHDSNTTSSDLDQGGNYSKNCVGCHSTGIRDIYQDASGEWVFKGFPASLYENNDPMYFDYDGDGIFDLMNIGCEACHGPGGDHVLGAGDPDAMLGEADLHAPLGNEVCGRCHSQFSSTPNKTFSWPFDDENMVNWTPYTGAPLEDYYIDTANYWPDGKHAHTTRPYNDYIKSSKPTFAYHQVVCTECHSPHSASGHYQLRTRITEETDEGELRIATEAENNTLCLACHATHGAFEEITKEMVAEYELYEGAIGEVVAHHSNHPYGPERMMGLARCTLCHMPTMSGHGSLTLPSHSFEAVSPEKTLMYQAEGGMPNSCAISCHDQKVNIFGLGLDPNTRNTVWNEQFDVDQATMLQKYYGPGGLWWDTTAEDDGGH